MKNWCVARLAAQVVPAVLMLPALWVSTPMVCAATAEEDPERIYLMEETTVTASPIVEGTRVTRFGETLTIVGAHQIDDLNAQDLPASLRRVPGVSISRYNLVGNYGGGDGGTVFVRGHGSGRPGGELSTMVDGIPRFNGFWTHPLMDLMSLDLAASVEVQKSPQPVVNGNMSFSAVDVRTRRFLGSGTITRVNSSTGSYATRVQRVTHGGRSGPVDYLLGAGHRESDGHRDHADGATDSFYGRIGYRPGESWDLSLLVNKTQGWAHDPRPVGAAPTPISDRYETDNEFYLGTLTWDGAATQVQVKAYYDDGYADWRQWDAQSASPEQKNGISDYGNYGVRTRLDVRDVAGLQVLLGLDWDTYGGSFVSNRASTPGNKITQRLTNVAPYVMASRTLGEKGDWQWTPSAGARINVSSDFGTQIGAQMGLVAARGGSSLHLSGARAFNLPGVYAALFYEQYWSFAYTGSEWRDLNPEWLQHVEMGGSHTFNERVSVDLTWFRDEVTDALRIVPPPPPPPSIRNTGAYTTQGVEAAVHLTPLPQLRLFGGAALMRTTPDDVPNAPDLTFSSGAAYTWRQRVRLHLDAEYVDTQYVQSTRTGEPPQRVGSYLVASARAAYLVVLGQVSGEVFVNVENALDEKYEHRVGYPMPGRVWTVGVDLQR